MAIENLRRPSVSSVSRQDFSTKAVKAVIGMLCSSAGVGIIVSSSEMNQSDRVNAITIGVIINIIGVLLIFPAIFHSIKNCCKYLEQRKEKNNVEDLPEDNQRLSVRFLNELLADLSSSPSHNYASQPQDLRLQTANEDLVQPVVVQMDLEHIPVEIVYNNDVQATPKEVTIIYNIPDSVYSASTPMIFGIEEWQKIGVEIVGKIPDCPKIYWNHLDPFFFQPYFLNYALILHPKKIRINNEVSRLNLSTLKNYNHKSFYLLTDIEMRFGSNKSATYWEMVSTSAVPESLSKPYCQQKKMIMEKGAYLPTIVDAVLCNFFIYGFMMEVVLNKNEFTVCSETAQHTCVGDDVCAVVGNFCEDERGEMVIQVDYMDQNSVKDSSVGAMCVWVC